LRVMKAALAIALFVMSVTGFLNMVDGEQWNPKRESDARCTPVRVDKGSSVRFVGSTCDDGTFYRSTRTGGTDWTQELTESEFSRLYIVAQNLSDGWRIDISLDEPHVKQLLDELGYGDAE